LLNDGASIDRHFKANEYEWYVQDSWRMKPNITLTFGARHTILQTPWETKGQQVAPTIDSHSWFTQREVAAQKGQIYEPDLTFAPNGPSTESKAIGQSRKIISLPVSPWPTHRTPRPPSAQVPAFTTIITAKV
jgi:hypothetical protein